MHNYILKKHQSVVGSQPKRYGVVKLAQDVHAHSVVSSLQYEGQQPKAPRKLDPEAHVHWVANLVAQSEKVYSCYEAGPTGFALHRRLTELGVENIVIAPVCLDERHKGVNNDRSDTLQLASRLDRYVAGDRRALSVVRVPSLEQEQRRARTRQRKQLQAQRLSLASQGRSLVLTQGEAISNQWWQPQLWKHHQVNLAPWLVRHLEVFRRIILAVDQEIQQIEQQIQTERQARRQAKPKYAGDLSLEVIEAEVGDWNRFTSWRKAGSYSGLTGGVSSSGEYHQDLSITKRGNRRLRTALIEMAWRLVRHQPNYWLTRKWAAVLDRRAQAHRRQRKRAIVAYARALFVDLWKWKTGRVAAQQLGWDMV